MQTDLRLLLLIIGLVFGAYIIYNAFKKRHFKAPAHLRNEFEHAILEATHAGNRKKRDNLHLGENDPLLDDYLGKAQPVTNRANPNGMIDNDLDESLMNIDEESYYAQSQNNTSDAKHNQQSQEKPQELIILSILPKSPQGFEGHMLLAALRANNFHYGKQRIFHRHANDNPTQPVLYSVASIMEPGIFDRHEMANDRFEGIIMWAHLPCQFNSQNTFEQMFTSARQLASSLNGVLCDDKRKPMSTHAIAQYRVKIRELARQYPNEFEELR